MPPWECQKPPFSSCSREARPPYGSDANPCKEPAIRPDDSNAVNPRQPPANGESDPPILAPSRFHLNPEDMGNEWPGEFAYCIPPDSHWQSFFGPTWRRGEHLSSRCTPTMRSSRTELSGARALIIPPFVWGVKSSISARGSRAALQVLPLSCCHLQGRPSIQHAAESGGLPTRCCGAWRSWSTRQEPRRPKARFRRQDCHPQNGACPDWSRVTRCRDAPGEPLCRVIQC